MTPPPRKIFDPPLSLREFLDHALTIANDPSEPSEVRAAAMTALSVNLATVEAEAESFRKISSSPPLPLPLRAAGPSPAIVALASIIGLAVGVLAGLVLA